RGAVELRAAPGPATAPVPRFAPALRARPVSASIRRTSDARRATTAERAGETPGLRRRRHPLRPARGPPRRPDVSVSRGEVAPAQPGKAREAPVRRPPLA